MLTILSDASKLPKALTDKVTRDQTKPAIWWMSVQRTGVISKELCELAAKLMKMPSNSAAIERVFLTLAPTTVLFTPKKEFDSFGYEAEDKYTQLAEEDKHKEWYYFRRFKMLLHENKTLSTTTALLDEHKKQMPALVVFSSAIRHLKSHLLETVKKRVSDIREEDIHWVLTVPAIWNESAKQFMRESAVKAGIVSEQLTLTLEPEGASIFCKRLPVDRLSMSRPSDIDAFKNGSTYMVMDLGGGTVDITVHTVNSDGKLTEVTKASGGAWGGTQVDAAFLAFLEDIVGNKILEEFKESNTADFVDMMREFEIKKRTISGQSVGMITMRIGASFAKEFQQTNGTSLQKVIETSSYAGKVTVKRDKIQIDADVFKKFFNNSITSTIQHVREILAEHEFEKIDTILLVGGFAESTLIQDQIKEAFSKKRIVIPNESGLVVLNGAVLYGHDPKVVKSRRSRYTYGVEINRFPFKDGSDPKDYKIFDGEDFRCRYVFDVYVQTEEEIPAEHVVTKCYTSTISDVTEGVGIYASEKKVPTYVLDPDCFKLGNIYLDYPDHEVKIEMQFGGTEFSVMITDLRTGAKRVGVFNFLSH